MGNFKIDNFVFCEQFQYSIFFKFIFVRVCYATYYNKLFRFGFVYRTYNHVSSPVVIDFIQFRLLAT